MNILLQIPLEDFSELFWKALGGMITILLSIIAYFLNNFTKDMKGMKNAILEMQLNNASQTASTKAFVDSCDKVNMQIDRRLTRHGERLDKHETEIQVLKVKTHKL